MSDVIETVKIFAAARISSGQGVQDSMIVGYFDLAEKIEAEAARRSQKPAPVKP